MGKRSLGNCIGLQAIGRVGVCAQRYDLIGYTSVGKGAI